MKNMHTDLRVSRAEKLTPFILCTSVGCMGQVVFVVLNVCQYVKCLMSFFFLAFLSAIKGYQSEREGTSE